MSEDENVETITRMVAAWNRKDLEGVLAFADPEIEYVNQPDAIEPGTRRGHEGLTTVLRAQWEIMPATHFVERFEIRGDEIMTIGGFTVQMPGSESRITDHSLVAWKVRDGKVLRMEVLGTGSSFFPALAEAGLT